MVSSGTDITLPHQMCTCLAQLPRHPGTDDLQPHIGSPTSFYGTPFPILKQRLGLHRRFPLPLSRLRRRVVHSQSADKSDDVAGLQADANEIQSDGHIDLYNSRLNCFGKGLRHC